MAASLQARVLCHLGSILAFALIFLSVVCASHVITVEDVDAGLTCWTCPNKSDNEACNNWAPDRQCPTNQTVCKTVHQYSIVSGQSVGVIKTCTTEKECSLDMVGCVASGITGVETCVSCCNVDYCNEAVPTNHSTARSLSTMPNMAVTVALPVRTDILVLSLIASTLLHNSYDLVHFYPERVT